jgi:hypothetical protein
MKKDSFTKHLIQCKCISPIFQNKSNPVFHSFVVFSVFVDSNEDSIIEKFVQCNNCGIVHRVFNICESDIISEKESSSSIIDIEDIKLSLNSKLIEILERHESDLPTWEETKHKFENKIYDSPIILTRERSSDFILGKLLILKENELYKIESYTRSEVLK